MQTWSKEEFYFIYERQVDMVYKLCKIYLKNENDARDGVQEVFLKLWEKKPEFSDQQHEKAWLIRVTKNYCFNQLKSSWFRKRIDIEDWTVIPAKSATENNELLEMVMALSAKFREVLYLYYYEGFSVREISVLLQRKESTIQSQLAAGRKKLEKLLENR